VLQLARDAVHAEKQLLSLDRMPVPRQLCRAVRAEEGSELCGAKVVASGLWLGDAGWVTGPAAVARTIEAAGEAIRVRCAPSVSVSEDSHGSVLIRTDGGDVLETPCAILANGHEAAALLPDTALGLRPVRGQASLIAPGPAGLRAPVCQDGYVTPLLRGVHVVGATYDEESSELSARTDDDRANLARARRMLPGAFGESHAVVGNWVGLRSVSRDRRPVLGALAPGLYACLAMGSRGFTWAPLAGELIASMIAGDPWPVERSIAEAISPGRFAKDKDQSQRPK
jgi:tRNA 5-methylaminomethyl-2-thiouridine biosynthesis bifunctional protein